MPLATNPPPTLSCELRVRTSSISIVIILLLLLITTTIIIISLILIFFHPQTNAAAWKLKTERGLFFFKCMINKSDGGAESQPRSFSVQILQKSRETHNNGESKLFDVFFLSFFLSVIYNVIHCNTMYPGVRIR